MEKTTFSSNNRFTVRLELINKPGVFAKVATLIAAANADLEAVDIVDVTRGKSSGLRCA